MRKIVYIFIVSLLITSYCEAQVSGFMGERWIIMYDIHVRPSFSLPNQNGNNGFTSFNFKNSIGLEYVMAQHTSIGCAYSSFNTKFDFRDKPVSYIESSDGDGYTSSFIPIGFGDMSVKGYSLYLKFFSNGNIAPLGSYVKLQLDYFTWDASYDWLQNPDVSTIIASENISGTFPTKGTYSSYGLSISFGKQLVYFDHFILNTSLQFGFLFKGGETATFGESSDQDPSDLTSDKMMSDATYSRMFSHYLWNFNIGIGYLIF